ncbi:hypothetical protein PP940_gp047 [Rhizobium phage RL2RES]|uniref:Uncharacterized protein n=1 Tax=Rhizobium phage RL2RES TaxID=103371 RepID=A0A6B9J4I1_9CAUD|nr:hypothetical protein PP940_gp047 [Rhizobium phage RL2RES]QGZ14358.1 hypothetical protein RL2RES_047 [Rhizobium phage RL2RES]
MQYVIELLDSETDEVLETAVIEASSDEDAQIKALEEANYQGYFLGTVTRK